MHKSAITVKNLSKRYRLGEGAGYKTFRESITNLGKAVLHKFAGPDTQAVTSKSQSNIIWALNNVSFEVKPGEVMGVIGRNGAGKSTLLKVLSKITEPTSGRVELRGRVGSLLEVGTGFHPELTGHDNIYLYGALLGMDRWEVTRKFDEIVEFAELEKFIETPVKRYSSGMYMRLAFAVAAHLDTEILLVDEVLAVGDAAFQEKCLGKMADVSKQGRTVLFVTHNMSSVATLCESAILLESGMVRSIGTAPKVVEEYLSTLRNTSSTVELKNNQNRRGTGEARIIRASIMNSQRKPCNRFKYGDDIYFEYDVEAVSACPKLITVVWIKTATGIPVLHLANQDDPAGKPFKLTSKKRICCALKNCKLIPGSYLVSFWIAPDHYSNVDFVSDAIQFRMEQGDLMRRGFDLTWKNGIIHSESFWTVKNFSEDSFA
jgi:lipopolysaccharide transport system ATP-binding protein